MGGQCSGNARADDVVTPRERPGKKRREQSPHQALHQSSARQRVFNAIFIEALVLADRFDPVRVPPELEGPAHLFVAELLAAHVSIMARLPPEPQRSRAD